MRRAALVAIAALAAPSAAHAACGVTATHATGKAPVTVTLTATCASTQYHWSFGDGQEADGQTVQHVYPAGVYRPTLTSDVGVEPAATVLSVALELRAPARARYAQWVTLRASVTPRLPVVFHGRRFVHGKLRVRVLGTAPWVANAVGVKSKPARTVVVPKLVVRLVGAPIVASRMRVQATLHPASAGTVVGPRTVDTRTARIARVTVRTRPAKGWAAVHESVARTIVRPSLATGAHGPGVLQLERVLRDLHYAVQVDGVYGDDDVEAIYAFQKVAGLSRTGVVTPALWERLLHAQIPRARYGGDHIEVDKARQVLFVVRGGKVALVVAVSTGATGNTPLGVWHVYRKVTGFDWVLYYPNYFLRGFAVHGYPDVPPYPASHGCVRIPMWVATRVYGDIAVGTAVYVYL
jgi:peptidoglycan hydrolase-like protein with peptidoglycan-binding domain